MIIVNKTDLVEKVQLCYFHRSIIGDAIKWTPLEKMDRTGGENDL